MAQQVVAIAHYTQQYNDNGNDEERGEKIQHQTTNTRIGLVCCVCSQQSIASAAKVYGVMAEEPYIGCTRGTASNAFGRQQSSASAVRNAPSCLPSLFDKSITSIGLNLTASRVPKSGQSC